MWIQFLKVVIAIEDQSLSDFVMSAFEYYSKKSITEDSVNRKRKNKKKIKKTPVKITKTENNGNENQKKPKSHVLNNIYNLNLKDSSKTGQKLLEWLIHPISIDDFMR